MNNLQLKLEAIDKQRPYFRYFPNQSITFEYQNSEFCGFSIQCPSSGKTISFEGTPFNCNVVYSWKL